MALSSLPSLAFVIAASTWLPESARFNATSGHSDEALETLERIAQDNGKPMLLGRLIVDDNIHLMSRYCLCLLVKWALHVQIPIS